MEEYDLRIIKLANIAIEYLYKYEEERKDEIHEYSWTPATDLNALMEKVNNVRKEIYRLAGWNYND